jgi:diguanylate cyclase (GGDEF)-like protein/PAS domain S-box-containing protein
MPRIVAERILGQIWMQKRDRSSVFSLFHPSASSLILWPTATIILAISYLALIGWATHAMILASWLNYAIPLAYESALFFIVFTLLLLAYDRWPSRGWIRIAMAFVAISAMVRCVGVLRQSTTFDKIVEFFFTQHARIYSSFLVGKMSPLTAIGFLLASLSLSLCALRRWNKSARVAADILAISIFYLGLFPLVGYLYATPLLYGGMIVPISLPSAILFLLLAVALMAHAPARSSVLSLFLGMSTKARLIRVFVPALALQSLAVSYLNAHLASWMTPANPAILASLDTMLVLSTSTLLILLVAPRVGRDLDAAYEALTENQRIAAAAFESSDGIAICNAEGAILRINHAFSRITGYSEEDVVGQKMNMLKSGRHDDIFYTAMWASLHEHGAWCGEMWNRRKNGETYPEWLSITALKGATGKITHYVASFNDITARKEAEDEISNLAFYDTLTHLPNRRLLYDRLQHALANSARSHREGAVMLIDLDNFKTFNDTQGHSRGDQLLQKVADRLRACVRDADTVARFGGDEFVVILDGLDRDAEIAAAEIKKIGETILSQLHQPYSIAGQEHRTTASIGTALFGEDRENFDELLKRADIALYKAKTEGRNTMRFFDQDLEAAVLARVALEKDLSDGILNGELLLYYQPQVDSRGSITGAEALVRWQHPSRGLVYPDEFIPLAEETGLILPMGRWVMENACAQIAAWAKNEETAHLTVAVNVSARQFQQPEFVAEVLALLDRTHIDARKLKLELTESLLLSNVESVISKMAALNDRGLSFCLDDFGTGYSSLSYLRRLPLSRLKIDRSFVRDLLTDINSMAIARTIVDMAHSLGMTVIAEGVETSAQLEQLKIYGCTAFQGYFFGRPLPVGEFANLLGKSLPSQQQCEMRAHE